jgi:hypothetical protein
MSGEKELKVRMPASLHAKIEDAAAKNRRSLSGEVVLRLEQSFRNKSSWDDKWEARMEVAAEKFLTRLYEDAGRWKDPTLAADVEKPKRVRKKGTDVAEKK